LDDGLTGENFRTGSAPKSEKRVLAQAGNDRAHGR
jgi:hypothetical protein